MYTENEKILPVDIDKEMRTSFLDYSMSVIVSRALPDVRDGLKPVHRRILYTMNQNGLTSNKPYKKCADTVGKVLGAYHPHGDASVYDALVRLAQSLSMRYPLIDGHGNFGAVDGDPPAAYRYTEARLEKITDLMLEDIDKETVDFVPNYDDTTVEPSVLPARLPSLLLNGSVGIAVGMATNIPPHNLGELVDGICHLIDNPDCSVFELMEHIKGPDFPTGGIIMGHSGIRSAYATGRGKITLRGRAEIQEHGNGRYRISITEIPYMVNKARMVEHMAELVKDKRIEGISDLRDESDRRGMHICVELKRDANPQVVLNQLYSYTELQDTVGVIMLALVNGEPKEMDLKTILCHYVDFQCDIIRRRSEYYLRKARERDHILKGLLLVYDFIDEVIAILRRSPGIPEGKARLCERFGLDDIQASAIVAMRLGQLTGMERQKLEEERRDIEARIADLEDILSNHAHMLHIVKDDLLDIKAKFGDERRTEIVAVDGEVDVEDLIPRESCVLTLTRLGYIKRQPADHYKTQRRGGRGISALSRRDEDVVEQLYTCSTHDRMLFITNLGRVYTLKCYEIPLGSRSSRGVNIVNLLALTGGERVSGVIFIDGFHKGRYVTMVTRQGIIKRTELSEFANVRKTGIYGITLDEGDELSWAAVTDGDSDLLLATKNGLAIRFHESDARPMGRTAHGVRAVSLLEGDDVCGFAVVRQEDRLFTVTEDGKGRVTPVADYRRQTRGGKGVINYDRDKGKKVAGVVRVDSDTDIILISEEGVMIRVHAAEVAQQSRYGGGVNTMRIGENDRVVTLAVISSSIGEEDGADPDTPAEGLAGQETVALTGQPEAEGSAEWAEQEDGAEPEAGRIVNRGEIDAFIGRIAEETARYDEQKADGGEER